MDEHQLRQILSQPEGLKLDFKQILHPIYHHNKEKRKYHRNELKKDIIALTNGNFNTAHQTGYLIIGAGDTLYPNGTRDLFDVGVVKLTSHGLLQMVNAVCYPPIPDLTCEVIKLDNTNLLVITIPPSPHLHRLFKELTTHKRKTPFPIGTVFIRRNEDIFPATPEECFVIQQEKNKLFQQFSYHLSHPLTPIHPYLNPEIDKDQDCITGCQQPHIFNCLIQFYQKQNLYDQANFWQKQQQLNTQNHPSQLIQNLYHQATLQHLKNKSDLAKTLLLQAIEMSKKFLKHGLIQQIHLASLLGELANLYAEQNYLRPAESLILEAIELTKQALKSNKSHRQTTAFLLTQLNTTLGNILHQRKIYFPARRIYETTLTYLKSMLSENDPRIIYLLNNLGELCRDQKDYCLAEKYLKQVLSLNEQWLGKNHPNLIFSYVKLAQLYLDWKNYSQAEYYYQQSLTISQEGLGKNHPDTVKILRGLAGCYCQQKNIQQGESLLLLALQLEEEYFSPTHPEVAKSLLKLGEFYELQDNFVSAEIYYQKALAIQNTLFGQYHHHSLKTLQLLGDLALKNNQYKKAQFYYQRCLMIYHQLESPAKSDYITMADIWFNLAQIQGQQEHYRKAKTLTKKAFLLYQRYLAKNQLRNRFSRAIIGKKGFKTPS